MKLRAVIPTAEVKQPDFRDRSDIIVVRGQFRANGYSQQFCIGEKIAARIGLTGPRHCIDLVIDDSDPAKVFAGFRKNPNGLYTAWRKSDYYWISIGAKVTEAFFAKMSFAHIELADIQFIGEALVFEVKRRSQ